MSIKTLNKTFANSIVGFQSKILNIIRAIPFFTSFRKEPNLSEKSRNDKLEESAIEKINMLKWIYRYILKM